MRVSPLLLVVLLLVVLMMTSVMLEEVNASSRKASGKSNKSAVGQRNGKKTSRRSVAVLKKGKKAKKVKTVTRTTSDKTKKVKSLKKQKTGGLRIKSKRSKTLKVKDEVIGDLSKSTLLSAAQSKKFVTEILKDVKVKPLTLLYKASRDGFNARIFHARCDNKGPTVTIIKASSGAVFGGYTSLSWRSALLDFFPDQNAFLFSLIGPKKEERFRKLIQDGPHSTFVNYSVYDRDVYHPTFGGGHDIFIARGKNQSFTNPFTYTDLGKNYLTGSERKFTTIDYEVYSV